MENGKRTSVESGEGEGGCGREMGLLEVFERIRLLGAFKAAPAAPVLGRFASEQP